MVFFRGVLGGGEVDQKKKGESYFNELSLGYKQKKKQM